MNGSIEISYLDSFSHHGEDLIRSMIGKGCKGGAYTWPKPQVTLRNWREKQTVTVKLDGVVAGRAVLSTAYYPIAEFENFIIDPAYRGRGMGSAILDYAIKELARLGYLAVTLSTETDNVAAQRLYSRFGFLPAMWDDMVRMVKFLNYPSLSQFLREHPLAIFDSQRSDNGLWELLWRDHVSEDRLIISLSGGSHQRNSNGRGPCAAGFETACIRAAVSGPEEAKIGDDLTISLSIENSGSHVIEGHSRLLLNHGFEAVGESKGGASIEVEPGAGTTLSFPVRVLESLDRDIFKVGTYQSAATGVECFIGNECFWLSWEVKVK